MLLYYYAEARLLSQRLPTTRSEVGRNTHLLARTFTRIRSSSALSRISRDDRKSGPQLITMDSGLTNDEPAAAIHAYPQKISFWRLMTDHQVITQDILEYDYPGSGQKNDPFVVSWLQDDPRNPMQFNMAKKVTITLVTAFATLIVSLTSSAYAGSISGIIRHFEISTEVATLGLSLFIFGFSVGPLVWAPLSESIGRQIPFFISFLCMAAFSAGCAGATNIHTLLILRFFAGAFGSSPLTNAGGVISDMFPARHRGLALCLFASTPYMGMLNLPPQLILCVSEV